MALTVLKLDGSNWEKGARGGANQAPGGGHNTSGGENRTRIRETTSPALLFGRDPEGYRPLGSLGGRALGPALSPRDLNPPLHARMQQVGYYLYLVNPLARRIVEYTRNYVIGDGAVITASSAAVGELITRFWNDPINRMDAMLPESVKELSIFGEQCWLAAVNPVNGRVRLGYLDPAEIEGIEWGEMAIGGLGEEGEGEVVVSMPVAVIRKGSAPVGSARGEVRAARGGANCPGGGRRLRIIRLDEDPASPTYGRIVGDCFYFAINKARTASRGISDLFAIADYLDGYDKMLFGLIDRVGYSNAFIWDVLMKGATEQQIQEWLKDQRPPRPGSVRAHNEQVEWRAVAPSLNASDFNEAARTIKNMNLAGAGFPEHWFADGGNVNRASALEMGDPTLRNLLERQGYVAGMIRELLAFVIDQAVAAGTLPEDVDRRFTVKMPEMSLRDLERSAQALAQISSAVIELRREGLIDDATAREMVSAAAVQLNVEMERRP